MARKVAYSIGVIMGLGTFGLILYWFGWKMALCIFLILWANNLTLDQD